jgi:riboflavin biosynthesis pyrimidine reductase
MSALHVLSEAAGLLSSPLPESLARRYGGTLGFDPPRVFANFVSSLDGVVALEGVEHSSKLISGGSETDRFVMGLLRAFADAVLIGAGTLRAAPDSLWTPSFIHPDGADAFAHLRADRGRSGEPRLVVLTARGDVDPAHPAIQAGALVLTTGAGAARLSGRLPSASTAVALGDGRGVDLATAIAAIRADGHELILTEGGPTVFGGLLRAGLVDELFLTLSPVVAGRSGDDARPGLVEGAELLPSISASGELLSVRADGSHLFLRYALPR